MYGQSKLAGEKTVRDANPRHVILRTSWVYSATGSNFLKTMLKLAADRAELTVVSDQFGHPTIANEIAGAVLAIAGKLRLKNDQSAYGTDHYCGTQMRSWAEFAADIFTESRKLNGPAAIVTPVTTAQYGSKTSRPLWSVLDTSHFKTAFEYEQQSCNDCLHDVIENVLDSAR